MHHEPFQKDANETTEADAYEIVEAEMNRQNETTEAKTGEKTLFLKPKTRRGLTMKFIFNFTRGIG